MRYAVVLTRLLRETDDRDAARRFAAGIPLREGDKVMVLRRVIDGGEVVEDSGVSQAVLAKKPGHAKTAGENVRLSASQETNRGDGRVAQGKSREVSRAPKKVPPRAKARKGPGS